MKFHIGDKVIDEDGNKGIVVIRWDDGDICSLENDAAHPNPIRYEIRDGRVLPARSRREPNGQI